MAVMRRQRAYVARSTVLLHAESISKSHGLRTLFHDVCFSIDARERVGLIGPNGAGKSTLLRLLAREEIPDAGSLRGPRNVRAVYVPQQEVFPSGGTVRSVVLDAALSDPNLHGDEHEAEVITGIVLSRLGFDEASQDRVATALSGGWQKRLALARGLASCGGEPDLLLLDEPTNHLDLQGIRWLEEFLRRPPIGNNAMASIFVTHDRAFLEGVATRVVELSSAYPQGTFEVDGNYSEFLRRKAEFLEGQSRAEQTLANEVRADLKWLARGPQARRTKAKSRILSSGERMGELADLSSRNAAARSSGARVDFAASGRRTRKLIAATGISKSMGGKPLFRDLELELGPGDCIGLLGANGSGKTTLIRVLTGELAADTGTIKRADPAPRVVIFRQDRKDIPGGTTLREAMVPGGELVRFRDQPMHITAWARRFLFRDVQLDQPISALSGGELARVHIARIMLEPADVLVLDEPTNDLDIPTLEVLEEAIESFPGAVILVTHDRAMLERLAGEIVFLDGVGNAHRLASLEQALAAEGIAARHAQQLERSQRSGKNEALAKSNERAQPKAQPKAQPDTQPETGSMPSTTSASRASTGTTPPTAPRRKLSFNEQREFDAIEGKILTAEEVVKKAEHRVNDPAVMADHTAMTKACRDLEAAHTAVAVLYARWAELDGKRS